MLEFPNVGMLRFMGMVKLATIVQESERQMSWKSIEY